MKRSDILKRSKHIIRKFIFNIILIFIFIVNLCGCGDTTKKEVDVPLISKYSGSGANKQYQTSYLVDINTSETSQELKSQNLLLLKSLEEPLLSNFGISYFDDRIKKSEIIVNVYYDFQPIRFRTSNDKEFSINYKFYLNNNTEIMLPIYLDKKSLVKDDKIHKIFITFTTGIDKYAADLNSVANTYGDSIIYDLIYTSNFKKEIYFDDSNGIDPKKYYETMYGFTINDDYNSIFMEENKGASLPNTKYNVKANKNFKLHYIIPTKGNKYCVLIINVGYKSVIINNNKKYQIINLDEKQGTATGDIEITIPNEKGYSELTGYLIYEPFERVHMKNLTPITCERFTLNIED